MDADMVTALNPLGNPPKAPAETDIAPRLETLHGKTVCLLDCRFDDSDLLLREVERWFAENMPSVRTKWVQLRRIFTQDDPETWDEIRKGGDAAIVGVGH